MTEDEIYAAFQREGIAFEKLEHPAVFTVEESAEGLLQRFAALGPATSGVFETYQGEEMPF